MPNITDDHCRHTFVTRGGTIWVCDRSEHPNDYDQHYMVTAAPDHPHPTAPDELESKTEAYFRDRVLRMGGHTIKLVPVEKGTPDRLILFPGGQSYFVELKQNTGVVSPIQTVWHDRAVRLGYTVHVLYGRTGVTRFLQLAAAAMRTQSNDRPC